jgi:hypothetical protein
MHDDIVGRQFGDFTDNVLQPRAGISIRAHTKHDEELRLLQAS